MDWPEQDGFSARQHIKIAAPDDERLRTVPPPAFMHLWAQFCEVSAHRQPGLSGIGPIMWSELEAYLRLMPIAKTAFKARMIMGIDAVVRREWSLKANARQHSEAESNRHRRR